MKLNYVFVNNQKPNQNIIFMHGLAGNASNHLEFQEKIKTHNYYGINFPGHSGENVAFEDLNIFHFRDLVVDFINEKKLENVILIGHSMGGAIASLIACVIPNCINKIILIAPYNRSAYSIVDKFKNYQLKKIYKWNWIQALLKWLEEKKIIKKKTFLESVYQTYYTNDLFDNLFLNKVGVNKLEDILSKENPRINIKNVGNIMLTTLYLALKLANPYTIYRIDKSYKKWGKKIPTLLILGDYDIVLNSIYNKKFLNKRIKNMQTVILNNSGHLPFIDNYPAYERAIFHFIENEKIK